MSIEQRARAIQDFLSYLYPHPQPPLNHANAFELLIATILSPQTTDVAVNKVTPILFEKYPDAKALAAAQPPDVENIIKQIGLYKIKAQRIIAAAQMLVNKFSGQVPRHLPDLIALPGVGRKVATVVLYQAYGINDGFTVDTHVLRLSKEWGLTKHSDPAKVEHDLRQLFPQAEWGDMSLRIIFFGREHSPAKGHKSAQARELSAKMLDDA